MSDLKPCPFCGKDPISFGGSDFVDVKCQNKACNFVHYSMLKEHWNVRMPDPRIAELEGLLQESTSFVDVCYTREAEWLIKVRKALQEMEEMNNE